MSKFSGAASIWYSMLWNRTLMRTMEIHHDKHHAAYVNNLNKAIESNTELEVNLWKKCLR